MALVRGVTAASTCDSSRFSVSGRMSTNTGRAPERTNAFAVETNVYEGMITSSPGCTSHRSAAISSPAVHDGIIRARWIPKRSWMKRAQPLEKRPSAAISPRLIAWLTYSSSLPEMYARLKGMRWAMALLRLTPLETCFRAADGPGRYRYKRARAALERHQTLAKLRISQLRLKCCRGCRP